MSMLIQQYLDAVSGNWIDQQQLNELDDIDRYLIDSIKVTYTPGKGNKLVPILFPDDTANALTKLISAKYRTLAGVSIHNQFVFASTQNSNHHFSGWHAAKGVCEKLDLENAETITSVKNRYRMATLYSLLEVPEKDRTSFFDHMGHSGEMKVDF